ncbi:MAG: KEOPS complex kinase/ATPase Bud32 [Promethearchaeota archaeon]
MSKLIAKGAEASLYLESFYGHPVIRKHRRPKPYRLPQLDSKLRGERTIREARLLSAARQIGVATPVLYQVDVDSATIIMEFIDGDRVKEVVPEMPPAKRRKLFQEIGKSVGNLHGHEIAHGDLTTSNMLMRNSQCIYFIDFGLAQNTQNIEDFGTDIHLLRRVLLSTHYPHWEHCYKAFQEGYRTTFGKTSDDVFRKVEAIESRGRYITERIR